MSRTRLAVLTAVSLVALSVTTFVVRRVQGGVDAGAPAGASSWEVTFTVRGKLAGGKTPAVVLASPPSFRKQHLFDESWASDELTRPSGRGEAGRDARAETVWKRVSPVAAAGEAYRLTHSFRCVLGAHRPTAAMRERTGHLDHPPDPQADGTLQATPRIESDAREIQEAAQGLAESSQTVADQVRAFNDHVLSLPYRETDGAGGALDCLRTGGDAAGRSRLLVALCRNRGIHARVVTGVILTPGAPPAIHRWAEAWARSADGPDGYWLPACPTYGHFGAQGWPANYLVARLDDEPLARGPGDPRVTLFARQVADKQPAGGESFVRRFWRAVSLAALTPAEQHLARFLLLLPLAAVVVSVFRVLIGITTFGIFSPALLGLIFRDLKALPWGLGIFAGTILVGWVFRKVLDRYNLLLIPRAAVMLTLIVLFLLTVVVATSRAGVHVTGYIALFPLIILTHMVERFWTVEAEDGTWSSFKALTGTLVVSVAVALALSPDGVSRWMVRYPETLGVVVAALLLLGRYTGYRLTELYRFQDVIEFKPEPAAVVAAAAPPVGPPPVAAATEAVALSETPQPAPSGS